MVNEYSEIRAALKKLQGVIDREGKRHLMDEHLTASMRNLLEAEIIPQLENELAQIEKAYWESKGYNSVTQIAKTVFESKADGRGYKFEVISQRYRKPKQ